MVALAGVLVSVAAAGQDRFAGLVDPTRPSSAYADVEPAYAGPVLQSTMIAPGTKRAIISGKTYRVGDPLGAAVVVDIRPYEVVLNQNGLESRLRLVPAVKGVSAAAGGQSKGVNR
jgi:hypothetical protein